MKAKVVLKRYDVRERLGVSDEAVTDMVRASILKPHYSQRDDGRKGYARFYEHEIAAAFGSNVMPRLLRGCDLQKILGISYEEMIKLIKYEVLKPRYIPRDKSRKDRALFLEREVAAAFGVKRGTTVIPRLMRRRELRKRTGLSGEIITELSKRKFLNTHHFGHEKGRKSRAFYIESEVGAALNSL